MKRTFSAIVCFCLSTFVVCGQAKNQNSYRYTVNLTDLSTDRAFIELLTPAVTQREVIFSFPKIIPGTYRISDYGQFISSLRATDNNGKELPVRQLDQNRWKIENAKSLYKITYTADDIFDDSAHKHNIYPMSATNIEAGKNVVINSPGFFGFIAGAERLPFEISISRPDSFYASTSLQSVRTDKQSDLFRVPNADALYDAPIMYSVPDTASVQVGNCTVLISVYSPKKSVSAAQIADWMNELLNATGKFLGGQLPADKYAFIYYFKDPSLKHSFPAGLGGALEHNNSSFYYLYDVPQAITKGSITDLSSHEFFHIITPLTVASKEVRQFNWSVPKMSQHLWLYEGVTEYTANHVQVMYGVNSVNEFFNKLSSKITVSQQQYNDSLPFTELSLESIGKHAAQYANVYQKGALIAMCLDLLLLDHSQGKYGLRELMVDLGKKYGRNNYFEDEELFSVITAMTFPEAGDFFREYVQGNKPIDYEQYFRLAGVDFKSRTEKKGFSLGGFTAVINQSGRFVITPDSHFNELGKKLGYKTGDELISINGTEMNMSNYSKLSEQLKADLKEGDKLIVIVKRKNDSGELITTKLETPYAESVIYDYNKISLTENPTIRQAAVRKAWLNQ